MALKVPPGSKEQRVPPGSRVLKGPLVSKALKVPLVSKASLVLKALKVLLVRKAPLVPKGPRVLKVLKAPLDQKAPKVLLAQRGLQVRQASTLRFVLTRKTQVSAAPREDSVFRWATTMIEAARLMMVRSSSHAIFAMGKREQRGIQDPQAP